MALVQNHGNSMRHGREKRPSISVVVPAYNEAANLPLLLRQLTLALYALTGRWEIVIVDDGSSDGTAQALQSRWLVPGVRGLRLSRAANRVEAQRYQAQHAAVRRLRLQALRLPRAHAALARRAARRGRVAALPSSAAATVGE
jgi:GT2 family glycosyltransferase